MERVSQSPSEPDFVQNPYPFYERARDLGAMVFWEEYGLPCALSHALVSVILKDRRFGREVPPELAAPHPPHLDAFYRIEADSMLELEPPRHKRLRALVMRAFTTARINALTPEITALCHSLVDDFPEGPFDLIPAIAAPLPIRVICRLLGIPEDMAPQLLVWSNAMVAMYQARRSYEIEVAAANAAQDFSDYLRNYVDQRRKSPSDDLISELIAAEEDGDKLTTEELIANCILLLNAGNEASVHAFGNTVKTLLETNTSPDALGPALIEGTLEEALRFDPPLHLFTRYAYETVEVGRHVFERGDQVGLLLAAANRDPGMWDEPARFNPLRPRKTHSSFGAGLHFCVGSPLARLELSIALPILFQRCPNLILAEPPRYANLYHFHGLERLIVSR